MAAVYDQHRLGDAPGSMLFPDDIMAVLVEQLFLAYRSEKHSPESVITQTAQDLARLAEGSKALHTTVMASWQHLSRIGNSARYAPSRHRLPQVADLNWVSIGMTAWCVVFSRGFSLGCTARALV